MVIGLKIHKYLQVPPMKDEHDIQTPELFPEKKKLLKGKNKAFQRLHIKKRVKSGTKETTVSIETLSYEFLSLKLGAVPHTREANECIKNWLNTKMETEEKTGTYDPEATYGFSAWLKKTILWELVSEKIAHQWMDNIDN